MKRERQSYPLKMPLDISEKIKEMAESECMSKNAFIIQILKKGIKEYEQKNR